MILVIDTSSAMSALALLELDGRVVHEEVAASGPGFDLPARFRALHAEHGLTKIAVAAGPGSFTGLRVGVSFGLGLAMGFKIPIVPLPTLGLQAARSDEPVTAVAEAGRGRVYHLAAPAGPGLAEPAGLPRDRPVVGWLRPATEAAVVATGLRMKSDSELRTFGLAAAQILESALEVAYGSVKIEYMQSFTARAST